MIPVVLDSGALLVFLRGEPDADRVAQALEQPTCITTVSLVTLLVAFSGTSNRMVMDDLERLSVEIVAFDEILVLETAKLQTRQDELEAASAIALAKMRGLELVSRHIRSELALETNVKINALR